MTSYFTLPRLYTEQELSVGQSLSLRQEQAHFLGAVLRQKTGDQVRMFNGREGEFLAEVKDLQRRKAVVEIQKQLRAYQACPDLWLLFSPLKKSRNHFIVEKATELGVSRLCPVITDRTTSKIRMDKVGHHIIEAAEQTERLDLPYAEEPQSLSAVLETWDESRTLVFADEMSALQTRQNEDGGTAATGTAARGTANVLDILSKIKAPCAILIGPEGGFSDEERTDLRSRSFVQTISLGPRILRADTAALACLSLWQAASGDWQA